MAAQERALSVVEAVAIWLTQIRRFHYGKLKPGIELLKKSGIYNCALDICPAIFDAWVEVGEKFEKLEVSEAYPEIGVLMPVWNPKPDFLVQAIESVVKQIYPNWQLCIADDASTKSEIRPILERYANEYGNIRVKFREKNGHICRASNTALEMVEAPFTAFLDHDDLLSPHALGEVAKTIAKKPDLGFIYTDDDRINEWNVRRNPVFKPDFDCDLFYTGHLSTYDTRLIRENGGLRIGTEGSQDQDLRFRVTELLDHGRIAHIPKILYHWRVHEESTASSFLAKPYVFESTRKVYMEAASRQGRIGAWVDKVAQRSFKLLHYPSKRCQCSVIILTDRKEPSRALIDKIGEMEEYADVAIYMLPLRPDAPLLRNYPALPYRGRGFALACSEAAVKVNGDVLLFLAAAIEPGRDCKLEQLLEMALVPHIAMASGNIWYGDHLVNGGWYPNADGSPFRLLAGMRREQVKISVWGQMCLPRHVLGAPWQCMALRRQFCQTENFLDVRYGSLATVDYGLRAMNQNRFVAMNPWVNWQIDEAAEEPDKAEMRFLLSQKGREIAACGLRNPNLRAAPDNDWTITF